MNLKRLLYLYFCLVLFNTVSAQEIGDYYKKAEQFLPKNTGKLAKNVWLNVYPVEGSKNFWYKLQTEKGGKYLIYDEKAKTEIEAFDHKKLAEVILSFTGKKMSPDSLKLKGLKIFGKPDSLEFIVDTLHCRVFVKDFSIKKVKKEKAPKKSQSISPDKKWIVEVRDFNLFLKNVESGDEVKLTHDGIEKYEYASPVSWYKIVDEAKGDTYDPEIFVNWSKDSKKFVCSRLDRRKVGKLYMYQSLPDSGYRAKVWSYERPLPGEPAVTTEYYVFDVEEKLGVKIDLPAFESYLSSIYPNWFENNKELYFARFQRGYKSIQLFKADANTGDVTTLVDEQAKTMVEYQTINCKWLKDRSEFFWTSERDGWNHIYRYNSQGQLLNQVTTGEFVVRKIVKIDEKGKKVYFVAGGKEMDLDPYYQLLYVVDFDGKLIRCLTPEDADHQTWIPENGDYFFDSFSRVDKPTRHVVRSLKNGKIIKTLASANIDGLSEAGCKYPERFKVKARDGKTDLYGVIFYPSHFDKSKKYPVIDASYSGPQAVRTPKSFSRGYRNYDRSVAELGFIVITIDGLGSAWRSKAFHDVSHKNLGDIGAEDHISGIKQLAETRPWMDLNRVGIYGHSAGGYDAVRAMLVHPEFYKVGVSSAGNHDHRIAKAWWPEQYMGLPGKHYDEQSNFSLASKLEGKLLLVHGDMDNNVNPASSMRLAAEFIKHNKDFELLLIPNRDHGLADHPYFMRKKWDWFVKHLLNVEPPKEYRIKSYKNK